MKNIFFSLIFIIILCSCNSPFNSSKKYYMNKKIDTEINKDYPDVDMPSYDPNDTEDPFNSKEEWNNINYKFNGNELYEYFMKISFDVHTVPIYSFSSQMTAGYGKEHKRVTLKNILLMQAVTAIPLKAL